MIRATGRIVTATGTSRIGFVDAGDINYAGAPILLSATAPNADFVLTGPQAPNYTDLAATLGMMAGHTIVHDAISWAELPNLYRRVKIPEAQTRFLKVTDLIVALGTEDRTTNSVESPTGRAPRSFETSARIAFVDAGTGQAVGP